MTKMAHAPSMTVRRRDPSIPCCPQFRALRGDGAYPIPGYCALAAAPGALMIPSVEEFRTLCTTLAFRHCPWCESRHPAEPLGAPPIALRDTWACPKLRWSRTSG